MLSIQTKTQSANSQGSALYQATKQHLNNSSMVKNNEKWDGELNNFSVLGWAVLLSCLVLGRMLAWSREKRWSLHFSTEPTIAIWAVQWSQFAWRNALCNLSHKKSRVVPASLPGQFLSRRCFTLCLTMEAESRTAKQYKCHHCCKCKNYWGKGTEGGKKVFLCHFLADQNISSSWKKCVLGHPTARATSYCVLSHTFWLWASKNVFKIGSVKFANSLSPSSTVKKVCTGSKSSQGT